MYAILGITGQVCGAAAQALLAAGHCVRAIVRGPAKAASWKEQGVEITVAEMQDPAALRTAFTDVEGVFVMIPANFAPGEDFSETRAIVAALHGALETALPPKIVCLSSVGAHQPNGLGLITQLQILEQELGSLPVPTAFVRAAWFKENSRWDIPTAKETGEMPSFLHPLTRTIPMAATADIGRVIAKTLTQTWTGRRAIELEGPRSYSPRDVAAILENQVGRPVQAIIVARKQWAASFRVGGTARIEMLDGFNSGWIAFERHGTENVAGHVPLEDVLSA